jgi:hypothetical protein
VLGLLIGTWRGWGNAPTIVLAVVLAFFFGYALTAIPLFRAGLPVRRVIGLAFAADTVSITVMEIIDNALMLAIPGAMEAGLADVRFWGSLAVALLVAFLLTVPINRVLIARGRGHAVVHAGH